MNKVPRLFINERQQGSLDLEERLRKADVHFYVIPTSGPTTIWVDGYASYGVTAVGRIVDKLVVLSE